MKTIQLGISACLGGEEVRYDGSKRRFELAKKLGKAVAWRKFCPEVAIGLGVPRKTIRIVGQQAMTGNSVIEPVSGVDYANDLRNFATVVAEIIVRDNIYGFVVCKGSPSCGLERVRRYSDDGTLLGRDSRGAFTAELMRLLPNLPVEEDGRLNDPALRESFLTRAYAFQRWQDMLRGNAGAADILRFHRQHKFLLLAHDPVRYRKLGASLANLAGKNMDELQEAYFSSFMQALAVPATRRNHTNVLMHLQGFFKKDIAAIERQELRDLIMAYLQGELPRQAPVALLKHHLLNKPNDYVGEQYYLQPYPAALAIAAAA